MVANGGALGDKATVTKGMAKVWHAVLALDAVAGDGAGLGNRGHGNYGRGNWGHGY